MENDTQKAPGALQVGESKLMGHVHEVVQSNKSNVEETLYSRLGELLAGIK
jgi:hypothetical protein